MRVDLPRCARAICVGSSGPRREEWGGEPSHPLKPATIGGCRARGVGGGGVGSGMRQPTSPRRRSTQVGPDRVRSASIRVDRSTRGRSERRRCRRSAPGRPKSFGAHDGRGRSDDGRLFIRPQHRTVSKSRRERRRDGRTDVRLSGLRPSRCDASRCIVRSDRIALAKRRPCDGPARRPPAGSPGRRRSE